MILDAQHDRPASQPASVPDETHPTPYPTRPAPAGRQDPIAPADAEAEPRQSPPTNAFEAFGSFSG